MDFSGTKLLSATTASRTLELKRQKSISMIFFSPSSLFWRSRLNAKSMVILTGYVYVLCESGGFGCFGGDYHPRGGDEPCQWG